MRLAHWLAEGYPASRHVLNAARQPWCISGGDRIVGLKPKTNCCFSFTGLKAGAIHKRRYLTEAFYELPPALAGGS